MFEETVSIVSSSILAAMNNWFTPTVFFVLLNVVIVTIAFTSTLANQKQRSPELAGSPSVLQRLRSINFPNFRSQEPVFKPDFDAHFNLDPTHHPQIFESQLHYVFRPNLETPATHYVFRQGDLQENEMAQYEDCENNDTHDEKSEEIEDFPVAQEAEVEKPEKLDGDSGDGEPPERHVSRSQSDTKPSAGEIPVRLPAKMKKSAFKHFEEEEEDVEARRPATMKERVTVAVADEEVDAKADDFINKFRQQLKLQRVEYKEIIRRGAGS